MHKRDEMHIKYQQTALFQITILRRLNDHCNKLHETHVHLDLYHVLQKDILQVLDALVHIEAQIIVYCYA
jgi:hypothetical protein